MSIMSKGKDKMVTEIKVLLMFLGLSVLSAIVRYKTFLGACLDTILGFLMGCTAYHLLSFWQLEDEFRCGCVGVIILFARPLYDTLENFINNKLIDVVESFKRKS